MDVEDYRTTEVTDDEVAEGRHRRLVGGFWEEMGRLQLEFLIERGLQPQHRLLDVGCGALRAGRLLVDYLDPGNYYGIDINKSLIEAGYRVELTDEQRERLPRGNLRHTERFRCGFGVTFDYAIAQSVFTHTPLNHARMCFWQVSRHMEPGGIFYATILEAPSDAPLHKVHYIGNPYRYWPADLEWAAGERWKMHYIGEWNHPRKQQMLEFTRV